MTAARSLHALPIAAGGLDPETRGRQSRLTALMQMVDRSLNGSPSQAMQESARVQLGLLMAAASDLRACLPDAHNLRQGYGAQRAVHALRAIGDAGPTTQNVAALLEVSQSEALALLLRAQLKGWICHQTSGGRPVTWSLTARAAEVRP